MRAAWQPACAARAACAAQADAPRRSACVGKVVSGKVDQSDVRIGAGRSAQRQASCDAASLTPRCRVPPAQVADLSFVLDEDQQAQGFALLCMSRPVPGEPVTIEAQCDWGNVSMSDWKGATFFTGEPVPLWKDDVKGLRG